MRDGRFMSINWLFKMTLNEELKRHVPNSAVLSFIREAISLSQDLEIIGSKWLTLSIDPYSSILYSLLLQ